MIRLPAEHPALVAGTRSSDVGAFVEVVAGIDHLDGGLRRAVRPSLYRRIAIATNTADEQRARARRTQPACGEIVRLSRVRGASTTSAGVWRE